MGNGLSEVRINPTDGIEVILSPLRAKRPYWKGFNSQKRLCPFCEGNEHLTPPELFSVRDKGTKANEKGWKVRVIPNKYPIFSPETNARGDSNSGKEPLFKKFSVEGFHEVIVETPKHDLSFEDLSVTQLEYVFGAYLERIKFMEGHGEIRYVSLFKNHGDRAGASILHSHSQLIATPFIPPRLKRIIKNMYGYYKNHRRCMMCDIIREERKCGLRVVCESSNFIAIMPFGSGMPYEISIIPVLHSWSLMYESSEIISELLLVIKSSILALKKTLGEFSYNIIYTLPPLKQDEFSVWKEPEEDGVFHWYLSIVPRQVTFGGFELLGGMFVNSFLPEKWASHIRKDLEEIFNSLKCS